MFKHILIPTDGSETAGKAVQAGVDFARDAKAKVTCFTAMPEYQIPMQTELMSKHGLSPEEHARLCREKSDAIFADVAGRASAAGVEFATDYVLSDRPYEAIIDAAKRHGCDLIFMASHGRRGISALLHGSQTQDVLTHSTIPTLVYR